MIVTELALAISMLVVTPPSPRLAALERAAAAGDTLAVRDFWLEVSRTGAPLIEPGQTPRERLVTFVWKSAADTRVVVLADFADYVPRMTMKRLAATDVWYTTVRLPSDARFLYELAVDDPAYPFVAGDSVVWPKAPRHDPFNPQRYEYAAPRILSIAALPDAPSLAVAQRDSAVPRGVVGRFSTFLDSKILGNQRGIWVYQPPGYSGTAAAYPLLIFSASYTGQIRLPNILDNLVAQRRIPPVVAVFVSHPAATQDDELGCGDAFGNFIATELLPWVRTKVNVTSDPRLVTIGGASAGGHSASCVALQHPEAIGNVIAQSGAFWRGIGNTADYWSDPARDAGREGFARMAAAKPAAPVRYYLTVGALERGNAFSADLPSMVHVARHVRDVLEAKQYQVVLCETAGGHDPHNWEAVLPDALIAILAGPFAPCARR